MYFPIDYYRFRNYRNIDAVFVSDNIISILFLRKKYKNKSDLVSYRSSAIVFIRSCCRSTEAGGGGPQAVAALKTQIASEGLGVPAGAVRSS
jgi:hypothetical protein